MFKAINICLKYELVYIKYLEQCLAHTAYKSPFSYYSNWKLNSKLIWRVNLNFWKLFFINNSIPQEILNTYSATFPWQFFSSFGIILSSMATSAFLTGKNSPDHSLPSTVTRQEWATPFPKTIFKKFGRSKIFWLLDKKKYIYIHKWHLNFILTS